MLETYEPNPVWSADAHEAAVETLSALREMDVTIHLWCADWCGDCRSVLPDLAAAFEAAGIYDQVRVHPVDREKNGELTDEYGVELIPTVVVEDADGEELARFEESAPVSAAEYLADQIAERVPDAV